MYECDKLVAAIEDAISDLEGVSQRLIETDRMGEVNYITKAAASSEIDSVNAKLRRLIDDNEEDEDGDEDRMIASF